ncbi:MAG: penicillin-binding protein 1C [Lutimonas sp.]
MPLFEDPYSTVLTDENDQLLSAKIAKDGQWRFPEVEKVPENFSTAIRYFEDEYFYYHFGVNPVSIWRAGFQNISSNRIVSGGSTITMQVVRLLRKNKSRSYGEKAIELIMAMKLELFKSKDEVMKMYVSHAPYGGNVVGADAASWRYFERPLNQLSWAEYSMLAVLPNAPSLMHPGKNREDLFKKRNTLLKKLYDNEAIDSITYSLAIMEDIPMKPKPLPRMAFHLLDFAVKSGKEGSRIATSIDRNLQENLSIKLDNYVNVLSQNQIRNACAMVISVKDNTVKAYIGNTNLISSGARFVDLIQAPRSSGSILKPFLYAKSIDEGLIHTSTLLRDVPISLNKFSPSNFDKRFEGVVPAGEALARSLNVPATLLLQKYGLEPFHNDLQSLGFSNINRGPGNYGLTLILGGAEVSLWNVMGAYANQVKQLCDYSENEVKKTGVKVWNDSEQIKPASNMASNGSWYLISKALTEVQRPGLDKNWKNFSSSRQISWKTGTSHGFRDAWAVGFNAEYIVGVWIGNAEGDGRPGLTGVSTAAPLMFQFIQHVSNDNWFVSPKSDLKYINLCSKSGLIPNSHCPQKEVQMPLFSDVKQICSMHKKIILNKENERIFQNCKSSSGIDTVWFSLDPVASHYYKRSHHNYKPIPTLSKDCFSPNSETIAVIYPTHKSDIVIPRDLDGKEEMLLFEAASTDESATLFWHVDKLYVGKTKGIHKLRLKLTQGDHSLLIMDKNGNSADAEFKVYK